MVDMDTTKTLLTFEEFEQLPARPGKSELLKGELIELPPAEADHNRIAHRTYKRLDSAIADSHTRGEADSARCSWRWDIAWRTTVGCSPT